MVIRVTKLQRKLYSQPKQGRIGSTNHHSPVTHWGTCVLYLQNTGGVGWRYWRCWLEVLVLREIASTRGYSECFIKAQAVTVSQWFILPKGQQPRKGFIILGEVINSELWTLERTCLSPTWSTCLLNVPLPDFDCKWQVKQACGGKGVLTRVRDSSGMGLWVTHPGQSPEARKVKGISKWW